ncbi:hypothetical protein AB832_07950 [Flavobacteriaceae bacterium (ex Bugula neritina AB1)]|nr:hypothetical protein AB832_07950 [Flavobacteriaceae bacterium (ex Bugula neritina AB1)]
MEEQLKKVINGYTHRDYDRTVNLAKFYDQVATGRNQGELVINYRPRETDEQVKQRLDISQNRTKHIFGKIKGFFRRPFRADKLKFELTAKDDKSASYLTDLTKKYGREGESLLEWLEQASLHYNGIDPNVFYWVKHIVDNKVSYYDPIIFKSSEVLNFELKKGVLVHCEMMRTEKISFLKGNKTQSATIEIYYYFDSNKLQQAIEIDSDLLESDNGYYTKFVRDNAEKEAVNDKTFFVVDYEHETKGIPVSRIGYNLDDQTDGRTYVSFWDNATELFRILINIGSEYDITLKLHTFLQKIQYYTDCNYREQETKAICKGGKMHPSGKQCPSCSGTGRKVATSSQDVILVNITGVDGEKTTLSPKDLVHYVDYPTKIIEIQEAIVENSPSKICEAVFGVDISQQKNGEVKEVEVINYYDTAQDALYEFTKSAVRMFTFTVDVISANESIKDVTRSLIYPNEYSLESESELLFKLKSAKEASASPEVVEKLNERLFIKQNRTDSPSMAIYNEMRKFQPFGGVSKELRDSVILELPFKSLQRALALNFKEITEQIIATKKDKFLIANYEKKKQIINDIAQAFVDKAIADNSIQNIVEPLDLEDNED